MFISFSLIFLIAALLSVINYKFLKLPSTIGTMILAMVVSGLIILGQPIWPELYLSFCDLIIGTDFRTLLLDIMLSALLFAGAIHINLSDLKKERTSIMLFATLGVLISTGLVACLFYFIAPFFGVDIPFVYALLFGALISPTDPIAVLAILKKANISPSLSLKIEGESLFNDGVGVVVFTGILLIANSMGGESTGHLAEEIGHVFLVEAVGGLVFGFVLGWLTLQLLRWIQDNRQLSAVITIASVMGGYAIAHSLETSGPLAMVVAGLIVGNGIYHEKFDEHAKELISEFWEVLDESLNTVLFVLIGMSLHLLEPTSDLGRIAWWNFDSTCIEFA